MIQGYKEVDIQVTAAYSKTGLYKDVKKFLEEFNKKNPGKEVRIIILPEPDTVKFSRLHAEPFYVHIYVKNDD